MYKQKHSPVGGIHEKALTYCKSRMRPQKKMIRMVLCVLLTRALYDAKYVDGNP
jgi:hypothetical protein